jgi:hypothetical protein
VTKEKLIKLYDKFANAYVASMVVIFAAIAVMLYFAFWSWWPFNVITYNNLPFPVDKEVYEPGDNIDYTFNYCKHIGARASVTRTLTNASRTIELEGFESSSFATGCGEVSSAVPIPIYAQPGVYRMLITVDFDVHPLRTITYRLETQEFEVVEPQNN